MNKSDKIQFERELVRVSSELDSHMREGKSKKENKTREELNNMMRHLPQ